MENRYLEVGYFTFSSSSPALSNHAGFVLKPVRGYKSYKVHFNGGSLVVSPSDESIILGLMDLALTIMDKSRDFAIAIRDNDGNLIEIPFSEAGFDFDKIYSYYDKNSYDYYAVNYISLDYESLSKDIKSYLIKNREKYLNSVKQGLMKDFGTDFKMVTSTEFKTPYIQGPYITQRDIKYFENCQGHHIRKIYSNLINCRDKGGCTLPFVGSPLNTEMAWSGYSVYGGYASVVFLGKKLSDSDAVKNLVSEIFTLGCELCEVVESPYYYGTPSRMLVIALTPEDHLGVTFPYNDFNCYFNFDKETGELIWCGDEKCVEISKKKDFGRFVELIFTLVKGICSQSGRVPVGDISILTTRQLKGKTYKINDVYMGFNYEKSPLYHLDYPIKPEAVDGLNVSFFLE